MVHSLFIKIKKVLKLTNDIKEFRKKGMIIGNNTHIFSSDLDGTHPHLIEIGNDCTLTHCTLLTHDASTKKKFGKSRIGMITIGDNCFIGWGAIILPNVKIGDNCIIGAGAVVGKDIPDNSIVVGNPCKVISNTNDFFTKHEENMSKFPVFNIPYKKMTILDKENQKKILLDKKIGYDD